MVKVLAKKTRKYLNTRIQKGESFFINSATEFDPTWMTHAPNQTKEAQQEIIALAKSRRDGTRND